MDKMIMDMGPDIMSKKQLTAIKWRYIKSLKKGDKIIINTFHPQKEVYLDSFAGDTILVGYGIGPLYKGIDIEDIVLPHLYQQASNDG